RCTADIARKRRLATACMACQTADLKFDWSFGIMSAQSAFVRARQSLRLKLEPLAEQSSATWHRLSKRERNLLRVAACMVAVARIWLLSLQPALDEVRKANERLPLLQSQSSQLDAIILEAKALDRGRSGKLTAAETEEALRA